MSPQEIFNAPSIRTLLPDLILNHRPRQDLVSLVRFYCGSLPDWVRLNHELIQDLLQGLPPEQIAKRHKLEMPR